ncbi:glycogen/starch/alpha-glucan phosphorylase [Ruminococcus sp. M6(2020)]|uniref:Alpha-1,4 glucan phosphorylase n=2 Tax=Ruminococcus difficilis TaxID=2763069 RepID=A0A934WU01_9FIRM|nr:glycogen/starch/alpha-glucan phosphorylase [Ruminococcus difficilis]
MSITMEQITELSRSAFCTAPKHLTTPQLHLVVGKAVMGEIAQNWSRSRKKHAEGRRAYYFSAEFLMGRMIYNNLYCAGILDEVKSLLKSKGIDINQFEEIEDAALGNGGLGRLAACFLDSAATQEVPLDGYGIFYRYGLFKQLIKDGYQVEVADDWLKNPDPWCIRRDDQSQIVQFADSTVVAVPYDMAIIGYGTKNINTLRLWQAEPVEGFDFLAFNDGRYDDAVKNKNNCENISKVLYPNDNSYEGKILRLKQQYFFSSASLQDIIRRYKKKYDTDFSHFAEMTTIQLNDTHPVVSIPELIRLLQKEGVDFDQAFDIAQKTFNYTNHTVMAEALEKWDTGLMKMIIPEVYAIIERINERQWNDLKYKGVEEHNINAMGIIRDGKVHMARLAMYVSSYVNGVAWIHTEILKNDVLKEWYWVYPERFQNKTNGITQRRWLGLCNPELASFITDRIGSGWLKDMSKMEKLGAHINPDSVKEFNKIKLAKKKQLAAYVKKMDGVEINPKFIFDIQVKRLHEYKRQLLNAFSIMWIYFRIKSGQLPDFQPTCFIFGAKAAPGYKRAKAIIKYINEIANLVNNDPDTKDKLQVVFVSNYNVSYAEKLVVAADISEQTSTAGTEASGTGNMKFMFNGAVTLGTYDGANVEIAQQAGEENEYIFGGRVEDIERLKKEGYDARALYNGNPMIKRVVDTLIDGTFSDGGAQGEGSFAELHNALINGTNWHHADHYFLLYDLEDYVAKKLQANTDYKDRVAFGTKCLKNVAHCGIFSSDRTILQYAEEIWKVK